MALYFSPFTRDHSDAWLIRFQGIVTPLFHPDIDQKWIQNQVRIMKSDKSNFTSAVNVNKCLKQIKIPLLHMRVVFRANILYLEQLIPVPFKVLITEPWFRSCSSLLLIDKLLFMKY